MVSNNDLVFVKLAVEGKILAAMLLGVLLTVVLVVEAVVVDADEIKEEFDGELEVVCADEDEIVEGVDDRVVLELELTIELTEFVEFL